MIKPGTLCDQIFSQEDWMPTLFAAAGVPDIKEKLMATGVTPTEIAGMV